MAERPKDSVRPAFACGLGFSAPIRASPFAQRSEFFSSVQNLQPEGRSIMGLIIIIALGVFFGLLLFKRLSNNQPKREFYFRYGRRAAEIKRQQEERDANR
jgi:hypothetical protein